MSTRIASVLGAMNLRGKRVLVTGANGFIGSHLAERIEEDEGARVRAMVRSQTSEVSETSEVLTGDITDLDAVNRAVEGCDIVVHCAVMQGARGRLQDFRRVNVDGTLNLLRAAKKANVARFIHISTINVHGYPPPRDANAESPLVFSGDFYSVSKAEGERAALDFARNNQLPMTVIRPACTYGPRSNSWTIQPLRRVRRGSPVLIGRGDGICNAIYIDNLIDLILLAMKNDAAIGQAFIGAEGRGVTWKKFFGAYAEMTGGKSLRSIPRPAALVIASAFEIVAWATRTPPRIARASIEFLSHQIVYNIDKSGKLLGYAPRISFGEGMRKTEEWLRASGYLPNTKQN